MVDHSQCFGDLAADVTLEQGLAYGTMYMTSSVGLRDITDGTSNTMLFSERAYGAYKEGDQGDSVDMWWNSGYWGHSHFDTTGPPNTYKKYSGVIAAGAWWLEDETASSYHPGGVNAAFVDGSVRFIKDTISSWAIDPNTGSPVGQTYTGSKMDVAQFGTSKPGVWQALCTRNVGEVMSADSY